MTDRQKIDRLKHLMASNKNTVQQTEEQDRLIKERKTMWMVYWRLNPSLYVHFKMGISLFGYQHLRLHEMGQSQTYFDVSTRGTAKSFDVNSYGISQCLMKPFSQVVLLAQTRDQATDGYREKFIKEFVNKKAMSPFVSYLYDNGLIKSKEIDKGFLIEFWNGSTFLYAPCIPSTRGNNKK